MKKAYPVSVLCWLLNVSRSGFYGYQAAECGPVDPQRAEKVAWVKDVDRASGSSYGTRRMARALQALGYRVGRYQARTLMRRAGIQVRYRRRYRVTTDSAHRQPVFENRLARHFTVEMPDRVYASDITYIWTHQGWLYLAVVLDLYSRKVVGWSLDRRLGQRLVCDALQMALWQRQPTRGQLMHHSDRGSQYASRAFRQLLERDDITGSMSRKGNCWDNAVVESFFGTLKTERVARQHYQTRDQARTDIVDYITMFYNPKRLHSALDYQSPDDFEKNSRLAMVA